MCGIAGLVGLPPADARPVVEDMLAALHHRGPDDRGVWSAAGVTLGMTRLAIIDLATGRQPMTTEDGTCALVFNGEIYNFRGLRTELERAGHRFRTTSDTEVLLRAWEAYGEACVDRLRGMFAFALWDGRRRELLLGRDRLGKKPLYYTEDGGRFAFASELKALLRRPGQARDVDWQALHHYLAFGYTPRDRSIFAGVSKLPPGHVAVFADGKLTARRYWALPAPALAPRPRSMPELLRGVRDDLREAVRLRLESDVPVGLFLSGGIDSSAVLASMREVTGGPIATFSIGFGRASASYDELRYARLAAERFETDHHEDVIEPDIATAARTIVRHFDEPFADSSAIPTSIVAAATACHVKVALSGIGGDEAWAGYPRYLGVRVAEAYRRLPGPIRTAVGTLPRLMRDSESSRNLGDWVRRFIADADRPMPDRYIAWTRFFGAADLAALVRPAVRRAWIADVAAAQREAADGAAGAADAAFRIDLATYLPDDLLTMADRIGMAHSLEVRAPFCDHVLIERSLAIPASTKLAGFRLKRVLKAAFAGVLPPALLRRRKQGFMIPLGRWLRGELRPLVEDLLAPRQVDARGVLEPEMVKRLVGEHMSGARTHGDRLWTLMMLEAWMREYLDAAVEWRAG